MVLPATAWLGMSSVATLRPASFASALIDVGVMSGDPTIFSAESASRTCITPSAPAPIETAPATLGQCWR